MQTKEDLIQLCSSVAEGSAAIEDAANKLTGPARGAFEKTGEEGMCEKQLWRAWGAVIEVAARTPHERQDRLVSLVRAVKKLPQSTRADGAEFKIWGKSARWEDLPVFGPAMRERWNFEPEDKATPSWTNLNAFAARLTSTRTADFSLYGIWTMRETLEDPEPADIATKNSEASLQAAAVWLVYAAESLWSYSKEQKVFDGKMARPGSSLKDKQWRGYSEERWQAWVERFHKVQEANIAADANNMVTYAIREITRVTQR